MSDCVVGVSNIATSSNFEYTACCVGWGHPCAPPHSAVDARPGCASAYRLFVGLFAAVVVPLSCVDLREQRLLQVDTMPVPLVPTS